MSEAAIRVEQLCVRYRGPLRGTTVSALDSVGISAHRGEIVALLGPNGSGKTTLLRVLAGVQDPNSGVATLLGHAPTHRDLALRAGWQPDGAPPLLHLRARDLLIWLGTFRGMSPGSAKARGMHWLERLELGRVADLEVRAFSSGMQRRLALCIAFMTDPEVLLLDEPTATLDPEGSWLVLGILKEFAAQGAAILLASHDLQEVEQLCDRAYVLDQGKVKVEGSLDSLLGTGDEAIVVRGLDQEGHAAVATAVAERGGEIVRVDKAREHLFALFRRLGKKS